jgi:hypothetical protein
MRRIRIPAATVLFLYPVSASAIQCDRPPTALDYAFCQDAGLRSMVEEGAQIIQNIWPRLNSEQQQRLRQDQPAWRERTATACGLGAWSGMISPDTTACLRREVSARNQTLRSLVAGVTAVPPARLAPGTTVAPPADTIGQPTPLYAPASPAAPQPPSPPQPSSEPTPTRVPSSGNLSDPDRGGIAVVVAILIIGVIVAFRALRAAGRRASIRRDVHLVVAYFDEVNRSRHFPECQVPINVMSNEFGLLCREALLWEMRSRRYATGGRVRIAKGVRVGGYRQYHYRREPEAIAHGTLSITNRRIVFTGSKAATVEYRHLVAIDNDSASITMQSSQRQTPISLSFDDAILGATLIRLFANDRIATNPIPDGITFAAEPTKPLGSISLCISETRH